MDFRTVDMLIYKFFKEEYEFPFPIVISGYRQQLFTPGEDSPDEYIQIRRENFSTAYRPLNHIMCSLTYELSWASRDATAISPLEQLDITAFRYFLHVSNQNENIKFGSYDIMGRNTIGDLRTDPWVESVANLVLAAKISTYKNYNRQKYEQVLAEKFSSFQVFKKADQPGEDDTLLVKYENFQKESTGDNND